MLGTQTWATSAVHLEPGDLLLLCSDGVLDLFDDAAGALGTAADVSTGASSTAAAAVESITRLASEGRHPDDVTVVAIRRDPATAAVAGR